VEIEIPQYDVRSWLNGGGCLVPTLKNVRRCNLPCIEGQAQVGTLVPGAIETPWHFHVESEPEPDHPPIEERRKDMRCKSDDELNALIRVCAAARYDTDCVPFSLNEAKDELEARTLIRLARRHLHQSAPDPLAAPRSAVHPTVLRRDTAVTTSTDRLLWARAAWFLGQHRLRERAASSPEEESFVPISIESFDPWFPKRPSLPLKNPTVEQLRGIQDVLDTALKREGPQTARMLQRHFLGNPGAGCYNVVQAVLEEPYLFPLH
jgi:hypothetical protein